MTKLVYLTTVNLFDGSAQSKQIQAMYKGFNSAYLNVTKLYHCSSGDGSIKGSVSLKKTGGKLLRTIRVFLCYLKKFDRTDHVFTRDMYIALLFLLIGGNVMWESHKKPKKNASYILGFLFLFRKFKVLVISNNLAKVDVFSKNINKVIIYHDCVSENYLVKPKEMSQMLSDKVDVKAIYTGAFHKGNDVDSLVPIVKEFPNVEFIFIGAKGHYKKLYMSKYGKYKNLKIRGVVDHSDIIKEQQLADILLYPLTTTNDLWQWTSPLKLFEYMASSKAIVASSIGPITEVISEESAFLFDGDSSEELIKAFSKCLGETIEEQYRKASINYNIVINKYTWNLRAKYLKERFGCV